MLMKNILQNIFQKCAPWKIVYDYSRQNFPIRKNFLLLQQDHCKKLLITFKMK